MQPATAALTTATQIRLVVENPNELWLDRVFKDIPPMTREGQLAVARPYVVCNVAGGGLTGVLALPSGIFLWQVKTVANTQEDAYTCKGRISDLLADADFQTAKQMDGGTDWNILSVKEERVIDFTEMVDGNWIYHAGAVFRVFMQRK